MLLGVALGVALAVGGLNLGPFELKGNSLLVPGGDHRRRLHARTSPSRSAARCSACASASSSTPRAPRASADCGSWSSEILPNLASTIIVFIPLIVANAILLEAGLSYLGAGVQPPNPSWGTMITDGIRLIPSAIHLTLVPGLMLVLAVLAINVFGDGVRDALDPRAKVRIGALMARFVVRRLLLGRRRAVRDLDPDVPDLPGDPERRPGAADGRPPRRRRRQVADVRQHVGLRQADLRPVPARRWSKIFTGKVDLLHAAGQRRSTRSSSDLPATLSLAIGAGIIWLVLGILFGVLSAHARREVHSTAR